MGEDPLIIRLSRERRLPFLLGFGVSREKQVSFLVQIVVHCKASRYVGAINNI
jgi:hypothetical protein